MIGVKINLTMSGINNTDLMTLYKLLANNYDKFADKDLKPDEVVGQIIMKSTQPSGFDDPLINPDKKTITKFVSYFSKYEKHEDAKIEIFNVILFGFKIV